MLHLPAILHSPLNLILRQSLRIVACLERQVQRTNTAISEATPAITPHALETIPGVGAVYCVGTVAEIHPLDRLYYDQPKVARKRGWPQVAENSIGLLSESLGDVRVHQTVAPDADLSDHPKAQRLLIGLEPLQHAPVSPIRWT